MRDQPKPNRATRRRAAKHEPTQPTHIPVPRPRPAQGRRVNSVRRTG